MTPVLSRLLAVLALLAGALLAGLPVASPAAAAEQVVTITDAGLEPQQLTVAEGDTVVFVNDSGTFRRAVATSDNWDLDSGFLGLPPGGRYAHPDPITEPGTYTYEVADGEQFAGSVVLPAAPPAPSPAGSPAGSAPPPPPAPPSPESSPAASPEASPTGGTGTTGSAPIGGGFGSLPGLPSPAPEAVAPPPSIALPELPGEEPDVAPGTAGGGSGGSDAVPGRLASPAPARGYGLPAALSVVLIAGVASLLVRLLLAEPAARRRASRGLSAPPPVVTAD